MPVLVLQKVQSQSASILSLHRLESCDRSLGDGGMNELPVFSESFAVWHQDYIVHPNPAVTLHITVRTQNLREYLVTASHVEDKYMGPIAVNCAPLFQEVIGCFDAIENDYMVS